MIMNELITSNVRNEIDKNSITLCTKCLDIGFKIVIFPATIPPLVGEMTVEDIKKFAEHLHKTQEDYVEETKTFLAGKDTDIQFFLDNTKFTWKKPPWLYGSVKLEAVSGTDFLSELLQILLSQCNVLQKNVASLKLENDNLKKEETKLTNKMEDMIRMKSTMEEELYKRFLMVLNTKKRKIRELEDNLQERRTNEKSVYNLQTDESETDEQESEGNTEVVKGRIKIVASKSAKKMKSEENISGTKRSARTTKNNSNDEGTPGHFNLNGKDKRKTKRSVIDKSIDGNGLSDQKVSLQVSTTPNGVNTNKNNGKEIEVSNKDNVNPFDFELEKNDSSARSKENSNVKMVECSAELKRFNCEPSTSKQKDSWDFDESSKDTNDFNAHDDKSQSKKIQSKPAMRRYLMPEESEED